LAYDPLLDDVGYMTCMTLVLLGNYAQTGHLGGRLAYTPYNVAAHLIGPENGGLRFDYRRPKHPRPAPSHVYLSPVTEFRNRLSSFA
jgi:hypothetical protein